MRNKQPTTDDICEQAARWIERVHGDEEFTDAQREELDRWLGADVRHDQEFRAQNIMVMMTRHLPLTPITKAPERAFSLQALIGWRQMAWAATMLASAIVGGWVALNASSLFAQSYVTGTGETRSVVFEDGSTAQLNTRTHLEWSGDAQDRKVVLIEGEALFDVARDPSRPFRVVVGSSEILVLGTRFTVHRKAAGDEVLVTVIEGSVQVRHPHWQENLRSDQQLVYKTNAPRHEIRAIAAAKTAKWREGAVEAEDEPLLEVLEDLSRYTDRRIVADDPRFAELRLTGRLNVRDIREALASIENSVPVAVAEQRDAFMLYYRETTLQ